MSTRRTGRKDERTKGRKEERKKGRKSTPGQAELHPAFLMRTSSRLK
jgi:hypothetical protein